MKINVIRNDYQFTRSIPRDCIIFLVTGILCNHHYLYSDLRSQLLTYSIKAYRKVLHVYVMYLRLTIHVLSQHYLIAAHVQHCVLRGSQ
jgi:hypothetical protein